MRLVFFKNLFLQQFLQNENHEHRIAPLKANKHQKKKSSKLHVRLLETLDWQSMPKYVLIHSVSVIETHHTSDPGFHEPFAASTPPLHPFLRQ